MNAQNWQDTLKLLCMMILADGKVYKEEVDTFKSSAVELRNTFAPQIMLTEQMAFDWFELHKEDILRSLSSIMYSTTIKTILGNLNTLPFKKDLILVMMKLALSDGDLHSHENKILERARETWNIDQSDLDNIA